MDGHAFNLKPVFDRSRICRHCHQPTYFSAICLRCKRFEELAAVAIGVQKHPVKRLEKAPRRKRVSDNAVVSAKPAGQDR